MIKEALIKDVARHIYEHRRFSEAYLPDKEKAVKWLLRCSTLLFQQMDSSEGTTTEGEFAQKLFDLCTELSALIDAAGGGANKTATEIAEKFASDLIELQTMLKEDAEATWQGDPAAQSVDEIILTYPGFFATATYRVAHFLFQHGVKLLPRILTEYAHSTTGIDIHPGAKIGRKFMIDHGTGVVIGGTSVIGDNVKIYQGVTLGAFNVAKSMSDKKRHPTLENGVVVYANATILGGATVVGAGSIIGGNVWLTQSVPSDSRVSYKGTIEVSSPGVKKQSDIESAEPT